MTPGAVLQWMMTALGFLGFAALAAAYLRASVATGTIAQLKENNLALTERVGLLEGEQGRLIEKVHTLTAENETLRNIVTGIDYLKRISGDLATYNDARKNEHDQIITSVSSVHDLALELLKRSA